MHPYWAHMSEVGKTYNKLLQNTFALDMSINGASCAEKKGERVQMKASLPVSVPASKKKML